MACSTAVRSDSSWSSTASSSSTPPTSWAVGTDVVSWAVGTDVVSWAVGSDGTPDIVSGTWSGAAAGAGSGAGWLSLTGRGLQGEVIDGEASSRGQYDRPPTDPGNDRMLAADVQYETLVRSLLIALVVVAPYGIYKVRQVRAARRERAAAVAAANQPPAPDRPRLEDVIDHISELGADTEEGTATLTVPSGATVGGADAPSALVDALVRDALRRSGLVATAEIDTPDGRVIEFRRAGR
mgnify:CR=1 FL=1